MPRGVHEWQRYGWNLEAWQIEWFTVDRAVHELSCIPEGRVRDEISSGRIPSVVMPPPDGGRPVRVVHRDAIEARLRDVPLPPPAGRELVRDFTDAEVDSDDDDPGAE